MWSTRSRILEAELTIENMLAEAKHRPAQAWVKELADFTVEWDPNKLGQSEVLLGQKVIRIKIVTQNGHNRKKTQAALGRTLEILHTVLTNLGFRRGVSYELLHITDDEHVLEMIKS